MVTLAVRAQDGALDGSPAASRRTRHWTSAGDPAHMSIAQYTRTRGRQLTYEIRTDESGGYTVCLEGKELLRGRDPLSAGGRHKAPNRRKAAGALQRAQLAIESLSAMDES